MSDRSTAHPALDGLPTLEALFRGHYRPLCAFAYQYLKDADRSEDLVQELFMKLWEDREQIDVRTNLKSYLFTATRNRCLNALKAMARTVPLNDDDAIVADDGIDEELMTERAARVRAAIEALPEQRRKVFTMSRYDGLKYQEIAEQLGISIKTVENHMGKALSTLRTELVDLLPVLVWLLAIQEQGG